MGKANRNKIYALSMTLPLFTACTGQLASSFRLAQQEETFSSQLEVNTKIDLLWVVDNSASMDTEQAKLRQGMQQFAIKYMLPTWDIQVAVITTDTYLANPAFSMGASAYLNRTVPGTPGWKSNYVASLHTANAWRKPNAWPVDLTTSTGAFTAAGIKYNQMIPAWGPDYAKLLPGLHDGPVAGLCSDFLPTSFFLPGTTQCSIRDQFALYPDKSHCLNPNTPTGETSVTQCVNTLENDSIHSGRAVISTLLPAGQDKALWTQNLVNDFLVNVTTGTAGQGSERGLGSVLQLISDNETAGSASRLFRPGSVRGIIFVSDEEDQTMVLPSIPDSTLSPQSHYKCDLASLQALNSGQGIGNNGSYCCADGSCSYGSEGTTCNHADGSAYKTIDGHSYNIGTCPREDLLMPVADVKTQLDSFFTSLDGIDSTGGNYFVVSIVPLTWDSVSTMQAARDTDDANAGVYHSKTVDRGDRYLALGNLVGNGSLALEINQPNYTAVLDAIGRAVIEKKSTFNLSRAPTSTEDMIVKVIHQDGGSDVVPGAKYMISGKSLIITDDTFILSLAATDKILINYQPKTVY